MPPQTLSCPNCQGHMEPGFLVDHASGGVRYQVTWVAGLPEPNYWTGVRVKDKVQYPITLYRCSVCGYLEAYADNPEAAEQTLLRPAQGAGESASEQLLRPSQREESE
ncbi:MAG TPA: hypothetical protein VFB38_13620 [Chthonomonadaceae bacterium]|nr:hypothetical protein [Chthonomonadaceae bacterium]